MRSRDLFRIAFVFCVSAGLAGCSGSTAPGPPVLPQSMVRTAARGTAQQAGASKSWMRPDAKSRDLLYVADTYTEDVFVYDYPSETLAGTLTGFDYPEGMCVDKKGDVFITNSGNATAVEYAHGGTTILQTFATGYASYPLGCAISPRGDLAISDSTTDAGFGAVLVYKNARGTPKEYASDYCYSVMPPAYDDHNNLWFQGDPAASGGGICELPDGASSLRQATINATIYVPSTTMWDGKYLALDDAGASGSYSRILRATASGSKLTEVGNPTDLTDTCVGDESAVFYPFIIGSQNTPANHKEGTVLVGANADCIPYGIANLRFWDYPAGGNPASSLSNPPKEVTGVAVSIAQK